MEEFDKHEGVEFKVSIASHFETEFLLGLLRLSRHTFDTGLVPLGGFDHICEIGACPLVLS